MTSDSAAASGREAPTRRIVAAWLPWWPTERLGRELPEALSHPFVTVGESRNRLIIEACSPIAVRAGLGTGMTLADGRAIVPDVVVRPADPAAAALALERLARWAGRFTPRVMPDGTDAILLDIAGCTRLFGGEEALTASLRSALCDFGLTARLAVADTPGAAWALARHGPEDPGVVPAGAGPSGIGRALEQLPVAALRLAAETAGELASFGLDRIGRLAAMAPAQLTRRFGPEPVRRLEQALGLAADPIASLSPLPRRTAHRAFADPISTVADIRAAVDGLLDDLCLALHRAGEGARRLHLVCRRVDGAHSAVTVGTSRPLRRKRPLGVLFEEKLEQLRPGFGIDEIVLSAEVVETLSETQTDWLGKVAGERHAEDEEMLADLLDRLGNRLGFGRIERPAPRQSWMPERAVGRGRILRTDAPRGLGWPPGRRRPLRLLSPPESIEAVTAVADGPPLAFRRRGRLHRLRTAEGPERLECEWWREEAPSRDYYLAEDEAGGRYWLYREEGRKAASRWFLHGLFA